MAYLHWIGPWYPIAISRGKQNASKITEYMFVHIAYILRVVETIFWNAMVFRGGGGGGGGLGYNSLNIYWNRRYRRDFSWVFVFAMNYLWLTVCFWRQIDDICVYMVTSLWILFVHKDVMTNKHCVYVAVDLHITWCPFLFSYHWQIIDNVNQLCFSNIL